MPATPRKTEIWTAFVNRPFAEFDEAVERIDRTGFDGLWVADSQNIMPEAWVLLSRAAVLSSRLKLGTFVTTPATRHAAVTASAAATLQDASGGRAILGVGRGDSALAHLGSGPMKVGAFGDYIDRVQAYLRGEAVEFDPIDVDNPRYASLKSLEYAHTPKNSKINWLPSTQPKVPLGIATSGPKVLAMAAAKADGVTVGLGTDPNVIRRAIDDVAKGCIAAGRDPADVTVSALISVAVHPDRDVARHMAAGGAASMARWQLMQGAGRARMSEEEYEALNRTRKAYDMNKHGETNTSHSASMSPEMMDRFAIAGPPDYCIARIRELMALGLHRVVFSYRHNGTDPAHQALATRLVLEEVVPALQG